jgi:hypothetical protein
MKKLFINILLFLCMVLPPLYWLDYVVNKGLRNTYFTKGCLNDIYSGKVNADVLFSGASKTKFQYSPQVFDSALHTNTYNIGVSGWRFHMQWAMFQLYMQHNKKPKYIIQNIDATLLSYQDEFYEADQYMPYAHDTLVQRFTHHLKGAFSIPELYIPLFMYNNHFAYIQEGFKTYFKIGAPLPPLTYKGYIPHPETWDSSFAEFKKSNPDGVLFSFSDTIRKEFTAFLNYCRANDIKVIFAYAPVYYEETKMVRNQADMYALFSSYSKEYNIPIIDYNYDTLCNSKKYFMNSQHLNIEGSEIFSQKLVNDIKPLIHL